MTMTNQNRRRLLGFAGGAAALGILPARAQDKFPSKPIEVVTHAGVGGGLFYLYQGPVLE